VFYGVEQRAKQVKKAQARLPQAFIRLTRVDITIVQRERVRKLAVLFEHRIKVHQGAVAVLRLPSELVDEHEVLWDNGLKSERDDLLLLRDVPLGAY
jgi:hypothetical protein